MVAEELPESQSLKGAMDQLLNTLQRRLLIDLGFSCGTSAAKHYGKLLLVHFSLSDKFKKHHHVLWYFLWSSCWTC